MLLDCWSYPGFGDFKEKWTMPAFVQGFQQSHDLYSQFQEQNAGILCAFVHLEEELLRGKDVLAWESFS